MIDLLYFASLREQLGSGKEQIALQQIENIADLKSTLSKRGELWALAFTQQASLLVSVNQQMADDLTPVKDGDEIAFFPPVTGG